eukprot:403351633
MNKYSNNINQLNNKPLIKTSQLPYNQTMNKLYYPNPLPQFNNLSDNKRQYTVNQSLRQVIEKKQGQRSSSLLEVTQQNRMQRSITKDKMQKIFKLSLQQLIQQVKDGNFTVEEIKTAYLMRALDLAVESNYLAELFLEDKDLQRSQHSKQNDFKKVKQEHSLYGLTFSVADWLDQYGFDTSLGLASRCLNPLNQSENSSNVKEFSSTQSVFLTSLLKLQASPLYRSSVNQSASSPEKAIFTSECVNNIWGRANNPHQKDFTTGGACGGEAALVSTYCVGMGIGVDQAGCTRYPASCCGVVAFKPTANRVSSIGVNKVNNRQSNILQPVITPIARSVKDITHILKCLWDSQIQLQFDNTVNPKKFIPPYQNQAAPVLRIGYYLSDGLLEPSHAVKQALLMVKEALEDQGHIVVEFKMGAQAQGQDLLCQGVLLAYRLVCSSGQMKEYRDGLNGEEPVEEMKKILQQASLSNSFKDSLIQILKQLKQERMAIVMESTKSLSAQEYIDLQLQLNNFTKMFEEYWLSMQFDAVISPASALPAIPHKFSQELFCLNSNLMLYNILDYPSGVLPVKLVTSEDIKLSEQNVKGVLNATRHNQQKLIALNRQQSVRAEILANQVVKRQQDRLSEFMRLAQLDSQGLPVGIQVCALPNQDEKCLYVMELIERLIGFNELSLAYLY